MHADASANLRQLAEGRNRWGLPWPCVHEFLAIATHPRIFDPPTPPEDARDQVDAWLESPSVTMLGEPSAHWKHLSQLVVDGGISGPRVHDARIAAICIGHGVDQLWSLDRDFSRFPNLRVVNPLA